jgi:hypothetical protein
MKSPGARIDAHVSVSGMRRKHGRRTAIVASSLLAVGCREPSKPAKPVANEVRADAKGLWRDAVTAERFARRVLYTWTTPDQIAALRRDRRLLVRDESPDRGASYYEQVVHALAGRGDAIAKLLDTTTFARSRFAWPAPWATREGWDGEQYGDQLIRVTLKPEAIVLALSTATGTFEAHDLADRPVALDEVRAHPERIGAVYFVSIRDAAAAAGLPPPSTSYRELVLCNEAMIAAWSVGTQDIADELAAEAAALLVLADELRTRPATAEQREGFARAIALDNDTYALDAARLEQIAAHLRVAPRPVAFEGGGNVAFPGIGPARPAPRVVPTSRRGTYTTFLPRGTH